MNSPSLRALLGAAFLSAAIAMLPGIAVAQNTATLQGRVVEAGTQQPISGAQVSVRGTGVGTLTNVEGRFLLRNVPTGAQTVRVEILGYATVQREVNLSAGETAALDFQLEASAIALDEVVVTGQGREARRKEIGSTISSVDATQLEMAPISTMSELLQGRSPGVSILSGGGKVGQQSKIVLRGVGTVSQGINPVIYVDGVRIDNEDDIGVWTGGTSWSGIDDINPADIDRVEIVKGAAAATMYGTEASAGVIQIFTKKGRESTRQTFTYRGEYGASRTPEDWWNVSLYSPWFYDNYVRTGTQHEHQLSTQGGREGFSYYAAGTFREAEGVLPGNSEEYYSTRGNLQLFPRTDLVLQLNSSYTSRSVAMPQDANNIYGYGINALLGGPQGAFMPIDQIGLIEVGLNSDRFTGGVTANYTPFESFSNRFTFGADIVQVENTDFHPYGANRFNAQGRKENWRRTSQTLSLEYNGTWEADLSRAIKSTLTGGLQAYETTDSRVDAYGWDFPAPGLSTVGSAANTIGWEWRRTQRSAGFFAQEQLGFNDLLFVTVGGRLDGHSAFGEAYPYEFYPKASVSWVVSEHGFLPALVNSLRLRAAYGEAGRQPGAFDAVRTWAPTAALDGVPAVTPENLGNPNLAPEVTREYEAGLDGDFWNGRIGTEITYFNQRTDDALIPVLAPPSQGFLETQLMNVGAIANEGVEIGANARVLEGRTAMLNLGANLTFIRNEILDLGGEPELYQHWTQAHRVGYPVGSFFGDRFVMQDGEVVEVKDEPFLRDDAGNFLLDDDGNRIPNPNNPGYIGPPFPTRTIQFSADARLFNRLTVRALMDHAGGHFTESSTIRWITRTKVPTDDPILPEQYWGESVGAYCHTNGIGQASDPITQAMCDSPWPKSGRGNIVMPADFWKLREVTVSYDLPSRWLGAAGLGLDGGTVYLSGRNLWRSQKTLSMEAEANYSQRDLSMQDYFITPTPQQLMFGLRVGF